MQGCAHRHTIITSPVCYRDCVCMQPQPGAAQWRPQDRHERSVTWKPRDPVLPILLGLLSLSLAGYFAGYIPYPFGLLILLILIMSRVLGKD